MKAPRFILREATLVEMLRPFSGQRYLEVGYGAGENLVTLSRLGYTGVGLDVSPEARQTALRLIQRAGVEKTVDLLDPKASAASIQETFDLLLLMEVIGYWDDLEDGLRGLLPRLKPDGRMIIAFTRAGRIGAAIRATGNMRCFTRLEIESLLEKRLGLQIERFWNYGYPLANCIRPVLDFYYWIQLRRKRIQGTEEERMKSSGLGTVRWIVRAASLLLNSVTLSPFIAIQRWFRNSDLGNGYVVMARIPGGP